MRTGLVVIALAIPLTAALAAGTTAFVLKGSRSPAPQPLPVPAPEAETAPVATDRPQEAMPATAIDYAKLTEGIARATEALDSFNRKLLMAMAPNETTDDGDETTESTALASGPDDREVSP
jgi:hypothetical protein